VRYENNRDVVHFDGDWKIQKNVNYSAGKISVSNIPKDKATLNFVGTGVSWIATKSKEQGIANIFIDGKFFGQVDQYSNTRKKITELISVKEMPYGPHSIIVEVSNSKNKESKGYRIEIDAFDVLP
jgi:hypothetical protein